MKVISMISTLLLSSTVMAQSVITITGTVSPKTKNVDLFYTSPALSTAQIDSAVVSDGKFQIQCKAQTGGIAQLASREEGQKVRVYFMLDGNVHVDLTKAPLQYSVTGSKDNENLNKAQTDLIALRTNTLDKLTARAYELRDELGDVPKDTMEALSAKAEIANNNLKALFVRLTEEYKESSAASALYMLYSSYASRDAIVAYVDNYLKADYPFAARLQSQADGYRASMVGAKVTDFEMADTAGVKHHLTDYVGKGKYVLVDFWASWCGPCMYELPNVKDAYKKYHAKGFEIVGLSFDSSAEAWKNAINKEAMPWIHLSDVAGWQSIAGKLYGVNGIPFTLLFDPQGVIVASNLRGEELQNKLAEIYK